MKTTRRHCIVFVTVPDRKTGRKIARKALEARAAACANILPGLESHYWWRGKLETASELLMIFKTTRSSLPSLERVVREFHPYETPEIVVLGIAGASEAYLAWMDEGVLGQVMPVRCGR